jgi:hypothetical protein
MGMLSLVYGASFDLSPAKLIPNTDSVINVPYNFDYKFSKRLTINTDSGTWRCGVVKNYVIQEVDTFVNYAITFCSNYTTWKWDSTANDIEDNRISWLKNAKINVVEVALVQSDSLYFVVSNSDSNKTYVYQ